MIADRPKILYAASTASHLRRFHRPYTEALREVADLHLMATPGEGIDHPIPFDKHFFSLTNIKNIFRIRKILKRERYDRIILHTSLAAFLVRLSLVGLRQKPYVLNVVHGYLFSRPVKGLRARVLLLCERLVRRRTDGIAVMNREDEAIAGEYKLCRGQVTFIPGMGLELPEAMPAPDADLRRRFAPEPSDFLCTFVGELSARKHQDFLLRAVSHLRERGIPVRLLLAGEGSEREALEAELQSLGLSDVIFLPGNLEPILPYLAITDLYVSAARSEGLPFNVMEAMAMGLPMVLSDVKGQSDLAADHPTCLYPLDDMEAFCARVEEIYRAGTYGPNACTYPSLKALRLEAVKEGNLALFWKGE